MATPPKPPKDPKPAARRAPRKAPATSTAHRAAAAAPPKQTASEADAPKAAAPTKPAKAPAAAKPATATSRVKPTPRAKPAAPKSVSVQGAEKVAAAKAALPKSKDVVAAGRAVTQTVSRNRWAIGAIVAAAGTGLAAFLTRGRIATALGRSEGHVPTDLIPTDGSSLSSDGDERAIPAFRPDMNAPMSAAEREALRPATGAAPSLVGDRGGIGS